MMQHTTSPTRGPDRTGAPPSAVFLDGTGQRRRLLKVVGLVGGSALVAILVLLVLAVSGSTPVHVPGFPDARRSDHPTVAPAAPGGGSGPQRTTGAGGALSTAGGSPASPPPATPTPSTGATKPGRVPTTPPHPTKSR
jgi:hypothetical protein